MIPSYFMGFITLMVAFFNSLKTLTLAGFVENTFNTQSLHFSYYSVQIFAQFLDNIGGSLLEMYNSYTSIDFGVIYCDYINSIDNNTDLSNTENIDSNINNNNQDINLIYRINKLIK